MGNLQGGGGLGTEWEGMVGGGGYQRGGIWGGQEGELGGGHLWGAIGRNVIWGGGHLGGA